MLSEQLPQTPAPIEVGVYSVAELRAVLAEYKVPTAAWNQSGKYRSVDSLMVEIRQGDCGLFQENDGTLSRHTNPVFISVSCMLPNERGESERWYLHEAKRLLLDEHGKVTDKEAKRQHEIPGSLGEKRKKHETPLQAAHRALSEELRINAATLPAGALVDAGGSYMVERLSEEHIYQGLPTHRSSTFFNLELPLSRFRRNGTIKIPHRSMDPAHWYAYSEVNPEKTLMTLWQWSKAPIHTRP